MMKWFECIPNISVGRNQALLQHIQDNLSRIRRLYLLHVDASESANRTVFTLVGTRRSLTKAILRIAEVLNANVDMTAHRGIHPRVGALDVVPIVPLSGASEDEAISLADEIGKVLHAQYGVPIFFYEKNARAEFRQDLGQIRKGEYEGLEERWYKHPEWKPDLMPSEYNPKLGATVIGARDFLIAFNINVRTTEVHKVKEIARIIRTRGKTGRPHALPCLKAIGWYQEDFGMCQVSTNLTNYKRTGPHQVWSVIRGVAQSMNLQLSGCELVGLMPLSAMLGIDHEELSIDAVPGAVAAVIHKLGLRSVKPFKPEEHILEVRLAKVSKGKVNKRLRGLQFGI